jgi:hypothetical protein
MFGLFKKKLPNIVKTKTNKAKCIVYYGKEETGIISRDPYFDFAYMGEIFIVDGGYRLSSYLQKVTGLVLLDNGVNVPLCSISSIGPIEIEEIAVEGELE